MAVRNGDNMYGSTVLILTDCSFSDTYYASMY